MLRLSRCKSILGGENYPNNLVRDNFTPMGFFNIFKPRKTDSTFPENELERCLMQAKSDVSAQKEFYQKLLWNQLFVLTDGRSDFETGIQTAEELTKVRLVAFEKGYVPVFTSLNRIFDKGVIKEKVPYLSIRGQDLFGVAKGASFILNPYSICSKELIPEEVENLMNGTLYDKIDEYEIEEKKNEEFNKIYKRAIGSQESLILLDGYQRKTLNETERLKIEESVKDFQKCIEIVPDHWQSMVLMAKSLQRLERHAEALELLESAFKIELENHTIPMEASLEAMHLKDFEKAIFYSEESLKRKPNDFALLGNHAMNLLLMQRDAEAKTAIEKAIKIQPNDAVNRNVASMINEVISGRRKRPTFEDTMR
jgi:tetratricopeptide (TPR) repeat protein